MNPVRYVTFILCIHGSVPTVFGRGHDAHSTFIKFTFDDHDETLGPKHWHELPSGEDTTNFCGKVEGLEQGTYINPGTPLDIVTSLATLPIREIEEEIHLDLKKPSLKFRLRPGLEKVEWEFGYPADAYSGIEIRAPRLGLFHVLDSYDPVGKPIAFDFHFAFISFCDLENASPERSSHQLDGKKFPLEVNMVFFSEPQEVGIDNNFYPKNNITKIIMISVVGETRKEDNPRLDPLIKAAKGYKFGDFDMDDTDDGYTVKIKPPFSPSWLLPLKSQYFYYKEGNFPVPPCFPISQVYVMKDPIKISLTQLQTLTNLSSEREPSKKFGCTFGLLRKNIPSTLVLYNPYPYILSGTDDRPGDKSAVSKQLGNVLVPLVMCLCSNLVAY